MRGINRYGRASQGVKVMNLREGDVVSAVALVVESESSTAATVPDEELPLEIASRHGDVALSRRRRASDRRDLRRRSRTTS